MHAVQVGREHVAQGFLAAIGQQRRATDDAGVVDEDVEVAALLGRCLDVLCARDIELER